MHFGEQLDEAGPKPGVGSREAARGRRFRGKRTVEPGISSALHASRSLGQTCNRGLRSNRHSWPPVLLRPSSVCIGADLGACRSSSRTSCRSHAAYRLLRSRRCRMRSLTSRHRRFLSRCTRFEVSSYPAPLRDCHLSDCSRPFVRKP